MTKRQVVGSNLLPQQKIMWYSSGVLRLIGENAHFRDSSQKKEGYTEVMTIMRCGEIEEILFRRSGASCDRWLSENSHGGKICRT